MAPQAQASLLMTEKFTAESQEKRSDVFLSDADGNTFPKKRTWRQKFNDAFHGVFQSIRRQSSYRVHFLFALMVPIAAYVLRLHLWEWCFVLLLIAVVIATEMLNTAIETLSKAVTSEYDERIGLALDIAGGAVLVVSIFAAILGTVIFVTALLRMTVGV